MLAPDDKAELDIALRPVWLLVMLAVLMVGSMFVPFVGLVAGTLLPVPISLVLFVLGFRVHQMNRRRIAEGKTSISVGRSGAHASDAHSANQAGAVFYMVAGAVIVVLTLTAPLRG
jgi:hypothetical protein